MIFICLYSLADLLIMNSLSFCLSEHVVISLFLKDRFAEYRILGWLFFPFNILNMSYCHLASIVPDEKYAVNFFEDDLYVMNCYLMLHTRISLSLSFSSLIIICCGVDFFKLVLLGVCRDSWMCIFMYFIKLGKFLNNISFFCLFFTLFIPRLQ